MRFPFTPYWRPAQKFWPKVSKTPHSRGCWLWKGILTPKGYGDFYYQIDGKRMWWRAHRFAYEALHGPIPSDLTIHHRCKTRRCVRHDHLELLSDEENNRRANTFRFRNRRKSHCVHGHPFDLLNTYYRPSGERECRTCRYQSRKKLSAAYWRKYRLARRLAGRPVGRKH
jgi:hypothetical protein